MNSSGRKGKQFILFYSGVKKEIKSIKKKGHRLWIPKNKETKIHLFDMKGNEIINEVIDPTEKLECFLIVPDDYV